MHNVLFLTKWYPHGKDPQNGIFVKKHALAVAPYAPVSLIAIESCEQVTNTITVTHTQTGNFNEFIAQFRKSKYTLVNFLSYCYAFLKAYNLVVKRLGGKPTITHANVLLRPAVLAYVLRFLYGIPYIITEHWTGFASGAYGRKSSWYKYIAQYVVAKAYCVTTVSEHLKEDMLNCGLKANYNVIPNVVDLPPEIITPATKNHFSKITMLTAADLVDSKKNISDTIRVISQLVSSHSEIEYHIVGGGEDYALLTKIAVELGVYNKYVFFHGLQNNDYVYKQLLKCDFVIINSIVETFSVFAAEALICGKPVITTICGGPEEFITPEVGLLIEKNNVEQLKAAILYMVENYSKFNSEQLIAYAYSKFSAKDIGKQFSLIYAQNLRH